MTVDCIPHAPGKVVPAVHRRFHVRRKPVLAVVAKKPALRHMVHHARLRECAPGAAALPLADLDNENVAELYTLPYTGAPGGGGASEGAVSSDAAAVTAAPGGTPAEASGVDLPVASLSDIDAMGGGSAGDIGLPPGFGASGGGGSATGSSGSGGGGSTGGGGSSGGGGGVATGTGAGGSTGAGGVGGSPISTSPIIIGVPPGITGTGGAGSITGQGSGPSSGGTTPNGPSNPSSGGGGTPAVVPEPATWALMLIGAGVIGGFRRRARRVGLSPAT